MPVLHRSRTLALSTLPLALALSGCFEVDMTINGQKGVPLSELNTSGTPPVELLLAAPDDVVLTTGDGLSIDVEGSDDAVAAVRFVIDGTTLGIARESDDWIYDSKATIRITMPAPSDVTITGSGSVKAKELAEEAEVSVLGSGSFRGERSEVDSLEVTLGGSGSAKFDEVSADKIEITVAGSGTLSAAGTAKQLDIEMAGSGGANLSGLKADAAEISVAGSGGVSLQSDGEVEATLMGSGSVRVKGKASCKESSMGSGSLSCPDGKMTQ